MPITSWKPRSAGARAIANLAAEIEQRVAVLALHGSAEPVVALARSASG